MVVLVLITSWVQRPLPVLVRLRSICSIPRMVILILPSMLLRLTLPTINLVAVHSGTAGASLATFSAAGVTGTNGVVAFSSTLLPMSLRGPLLSLLPRPGVCCSLPRQFFQLLSVCEGLYRGSGCPDWLMLRVSLL